MYTHLDDTVDLSRYCFCEPTNKPHTNKETEQLRQPFFVAVGYMLKECSYLSRESINRTLVQTKSVESNQPLVEVKVLSQIFDSAKKVSSQKQTFANSITNIVFLIKPSYFVSRTL